MSNKYYWLKLKRDFFKRHDIRIVEEMPNGKEYILFYLKLLCESVDHEGSLRFSDEVPYNETMLATITNTNPDIVKSAVKLFLELHMMEIMDDGTIFMREVEGMIGSAADNDHAKRQARYRERQKLKPVEEPVLSLECHADVTNSDESKSKSKRQSKSKNMCNSEPTSRFTPPTVVEVKSYCDERMNDVDPEKFVDFYSSKGWMVGKNKMKDWKAAVRNWEKRDNDRPRNKVEMPDYMIEQERKYGW